MLTITEAQAVNDVLRLLLDQPARVQNIGRGADAALLLAGHAHRALHAGIHTSDVSEQWAAYKERRDATLDLMTIFDAGLLAVDLGPRLTCAEANVLARWLRAHQLDDDAAALIASHADADDQGDDHYRGPNGAPVTDGVPR